MSSELRKSDLVKIKPRTGDISMIAQLAGLPGPHEKIGIVMDVYTQPQIDKRFVQVLVGDTIDWYPETSCELVQRGSGVVE